MIRYESVFTQGPLEVRAIVIQQKADVKDVGFGNAKVKVEGKRTLNGESLDFSFSFDGEVFKFYEEGEKGLQVIENPEPRTVGRTLGMFYYMVVNKAFTDSNGLDGTIKNYDKLELMGQNEVNGKTTDQVRIHRTFKNPATKQEVSSYSDWYFDRDSQLPIKFVSKSVERTIQVKEINRQPKLSFDIDQPAGVEAKVVTGMEADITGLPAVGTDFPSEVLQKLGANSRAVIDGNSKVYLVDFWGTWCGPCLIAMPKLQKLHEKYKDQGLEVIGISVKDKTARIEKLLDKEGFDYTFLIEGDGLARKLGLDTYPTVFLLNSEGKILHAEKGLRDGANKDLEKLILGQLK